MAHLAPRVDELPVIANRNGERYAAPGNPVVGEINGFEVGDDAPLVLGHRLDLRLRFLLDAHPRLRARVG